MKNKILFNLAFGFLVIMLCVNFFADSEKEEVKKVNYIDLNTAIDNADILSVKWGDPKTEYYTGSLCDTGQRCRKLIWDVHHFAIYDSNNSLIFLSELNPDERYFHKTFLVDMGLPLTNPSHERSSLYQFDYVLDDYKVSVYDKDTSALIVVERKN